MDGSRPGAGLWEPGAESFDGWAVHAHTRRTQVSLTHGWLTPGITHPESCWFHSRRHLKLEAHASLAESRQAKSRSSDQRYAHLIPRASRTRGGFASCKNGRMALQRMDNVGIVVESLDAAISFFAELGLELEGRA